ncbi:MAG: hypothetical protein AB7O67_03480 [Vicinamibacterales bacterium]
MSSFDDEIDALYQGPPEGFTEARNALAKRAGGAEGAAIRKLVKPQLAAWAVNQVYWRDRVVFDRLVKASEALRVAHRRLVSGEDADLRGAETAHGEALARANDAAKAALAESGETASPAVLAAVTDTLRALPTAEPFGRLAKPLTPATGFEAYAGIIARAPKAAPRASKAPPALRLQKGAATDAAAAKEKARAVATAQAELDAAVARSREVEKALESLTKALGRAERERDRRQAALDEAAAEVRDLSSRISRTRQDVEAAEHERSRLKRRFDTLQ